MKTSIGIILAISGFVCGAILGFILSPVKKGIHIGRLNVDCNVLSNNGASNMNNRYKNDKKKVESEVASGE